MAIFSRPPARWPRHEDVRPSDEALAWLPMAWFGDVLTSQALALATGYTCNCPEGPETARRDLREIGPTILLAPPHFWQSMLADIEIRAAQATPLKRALFSCLRGVAERAEQCRETGEHESLALRAGTALGEVLVGAPLRDQLGLRRTRWALSVGEPLAPHVLRFFNAFGINLKQATALPSCRASPWYSIQSVRGLDISVAANGEILVRGAVRLPGLPSRSRPDPAGADRRRVVAHGRCGPRRCGWQGWRSWIVSNILARLDDGTVFVPRVVENQLLRSQFIDGVMVFTITRRSQP